METSWRATLLGRGPGERGVALGSAGAQGGLGRRDAPPLPAGSRCATRLDRPDRMARQGVTPSASDGKGMRGEHLLLPGDPKPNPSPNHNPIPNQVRAPTAMQRA